MSEVLLQSSSIQLNSIQFDVEKFEMEDVGAELDKNLVLGAEVPNSTVVKFVGRGVSTAAPCLL